MINLRLPLWSYVEKVSLICRIKLLRACDIRSQCDSFSPPRSLNLVLSHSIVFHMLLRISLVLPVFLVHATAEIWRDFSAFSPTLIFRELWLPFTKLYICAKLKNVQSIVDRRNWTGVNYLRIASCRTKFVE